MANLNKVMLIGRLTRDPEIRTFSNGGKVAKFGFAVNNRKKNTTTGQWEDEPVFLDCEAFNRGESGKLADTVEQYLAKGRQAYLEGHLKLESWTDQSGQKRNKLTVVVDIVQFLEGRPEGMGNGNEGGTRASRSSMPSSTKPANSYSKNGTGSFEDDSERDVSLGGSGTGNDDDIPF